MISAARRRTLAGLPLLLVPLVLAACSPPDSSAAPPPPVPTPVMAIGNANAPIQSSASATSAAPAPAPTSTHLSGGQPIPTGSVRTGAAQAAPVSAAPLQPGTEHNHCRPMSQSQDQRYSDPPYEFAVGGEDAPRSTVMITYCGPGAWNVLPYAPVAPAGLPTFTPNVSRHIGISVSALAGRKLLAVFKEATQGRNQYEYQLDVSFNDSSKSPTFLRVMTDYRRPSKIQGTRLADATFNGVRYQVYTATNGGRTYTLVPYVNQASGTFDLSPYVRYAAAHGWVRGSDSLDYVAYTVEVFVTDGAQPFAVDKFSVSMS